MFPEQKGSEALFLIVLPGAKQPKLQAMSFILEELQKILGEAAHVRKRNNNIFVEKLNLMLGVLNEWEWEWKLLSQGSGSRSHLLGCQNASFNEQGELTV